VEDEPPSLPVDADVVVVLAEQDAVPDGCLAAVGLVPQMMHIAVDGLLAASWPFAVAVGAVVDGAADVAGDGG
jgi:hypothetical protein